MSTYQSYVSLYIFHILVVYSSATLLFRSGCSISVNQDLGTPQPLLLLQNRATNDLDAFVFPEDNNGTIRFSTGQTIDIACPGGFVILDQYNTGKRVTSAECSSRDRFWVAKETVPFSLITCSTYPQHTARYTNKKCAETFDEIEIGFNVENRFIKHISACFDKYLQHTLYSKSMMTSSIGGYQKGFPRPDFIMGKFYNVKPSTVSKIYTRIEQRRTINDILGLPVNSTSVISERNDFFLARGHYTPKADYVFGAQQRLTFYYVNVAPQWQVSNGGNWAVMESNCRALASQRKLDLVVYSGSFGVTTLPDRNGDQQELYLWNQEDRSGVPVPKLMFKVLFEQKSKAGIALVSVNNPYNAITEKDIICRDICNKVKWLTWDRFNVTAGYSYCCEVDDFRRSATFLPSFGVKTLLL